LESDQKTIYGEPTFFSITIPQSVKNKDGAISFVSFIISKNGSQILENQGLHTIMTIPKGDTNKIPLSIKAVIS
jgi:molybdate/tungstate transport system substrate-binding protein